MNQIYQSTTEWLFTQLPVFQHTGQSAYKPGLETSRRLSALFGNPHAGLRTVHVAGTNGKGSTTSTLAAILSASGRKVGLYTSPHLVDFRERIRVNGEMISQEAVIDFVGRYRAMNINDLKPSFFELTTIMAFEYFVREKVDVAVIEVGLGGRLDTTNIITPDLSVITNISLDHTALLGSTRREIAGEKAGIIKSGVPVVIGESDPEIRDIFESKAAECGSEIIFADEYAPIMNAVDRGSRIDYTTRFHGDLCGSLCGKCQHLNAATVLTAVDLLNNRRGYGLSDRDIAYGMGHVSELSGLIGRWTRVAENPTVICDTGHNIGGWQYIKDDLGRVAGHKILVLGFVNDKDVSSILHCITNIRDAEIIFTRASVARALDGEALRIKAAEYGLTGDVIEPVKTAVAEAVNRARISNSTVFVGGSNFVVGDYLS